MRKLIPLLLLCGVALADVPALSQDALTARKHYQMATALFNLGEWTEAAEEYKEAYKVLPEPVFLYNIAQAYRLGGDLPKAAFFYNSYARNAKDPATGKEAALRARKLEAMIAAHKTPSKAESKTEPKTESKSTDLAGEPKASAPSPAPAAIAETETPGPAWTGASERLGSMTDLIKTHREQFRFCYDAWSKKHPRVESNLKLVLTLAPDGKLMMAEAHAAGIKAPELERCVVAMAKQLTYPPSTNGKMTRFSYPFNFKYHP